MQIVLWVEEMVTSDEEPEAEPRHARAKEGGERHGHKAGHGSAWAAVGKERRGHRRAGLEE